jgi:hypothetical protein
MVSMVWWRVLLGLAMLWALLGIYKDVIVKRNYDWLTDRYLQSIDLQSRDLIDELALIKIANGCSMYQFRKRIMRPLREQI